MSSNPHLSIKMLVNAISIVLISCMTIPTTIAQPTSPSPETTPPPPGQEQPQQSPETSKTPAQLQQNSYFGFGGVIGIQGGTTSLSQGTLIYPSFSKSWITLKLKFSKNVGGISELN